MRHSSIRSAAALAGLVALLTIGCESDPPAGPATVTVASATVEANPNNVVSAIVRVSTANATAVRVEYGADTLYASSTPWVAVRGDTALIPVAGLNAATRYNMRVVATSTAGSGTGAPLVFTTGALPADLPRFTVTTGGMASPGYVMFATTAGDTSLGRFYALIVDNSGAVVWYRRFATQVTDFQRQPDGSFTAFSSLSGERRRFYKMDVLANVTGEYSISGGDETAAHELRLFPDGYAMLGIRDSLMDLSALGGPKSAPVQGTLAEYQRNGRTLRWSAFDHLALDEAAPDIPVVTARYDPWHANAIDIDTDGNLLVSFRNNDLVAKIDAVSGAVLWRLGGKHNQFTFVNDPLGGFSHQHGIRRLPNGNIILFDNGNLHTPPQSRAVEYRLDEAGRRAEMVWEYRHDPPIYSLALGLAQRLADGHTLICYGFVRRVIEIDAAGTPQWELTLNEPAHFIYRAFRIPSLY